MNKRTLILFILSIFLISVLSSQVLAQDNSVVEVVKNAMEMFTGVFEGTFGTFLDRVSDNPETWMRILFGFAIFSLIYAGLKQITALKEGRTAITLSLIVAIVSVVSVPAGLYIGVGSLYGGFIISALMFVPFAFLSWLTWKITSTNPNRFVYGIFFIFWMIFLMLMTTISITLGSLVVGVLLSVYSFIIAISAVIMAILFVLLLIGGQGAVGRGIARARNLLGGQPTAPDDGGGPAPQGGAGGGAVAGVGVPQARRLARRIHRMVVGQGNRIDVLKNQITNLANLDKIQDWQEKVGKLKTLTRIIQRASQDIGRMGVNVQQKRFAVQTGANAGLVFQELNNVVGVRLTRGRSIDDYKRELERLMDGVLNNNTALIASADRLQNSL